MDIVEFELEEICVGTVAFEYCDGHELSTARGWALCLRNTEIFR